MFYGLESLKPPVLVLQKCTEAVLQLFCNIYINNDWLTDCVNLFQAFCWSAFLCLHVCQLDSLIKCLYSTSMWCIAVCVCRLQCALGSRLYIGFLYGCFMDALRSSVWPYIIFRCLMFPSVLRTVVFTVMWGCTFSRLQSCGCGGCHSSWGYLCRCGRMRALGVYTSSFVFHFFPYKMLYAVEKWLKMVRLYLSVRLACAQLTGCKYNNVRQWCM